MIQIVPLTETSFTLYQVYELVQLVFKERVKQGMNFWATTVSYEDFCKEYVRNAAIVFVAFNDETKELLGSGTIYIKKNGKYRYAHMTNAVVLPKMRRCGIGSGLKAVRHDYARQKGCDYISCTTAIGAQSSVLWHKKNGYKIVGKTYWLGYYSYRFRLQLRPSVWWDNNLFCKLVYVGSCVKMFFKRQKRNKI